MNYDKVISLFTSLLQFDHTQFNSLVGYLDWYDVLPAENKVLDLILGFCCKYPMFVDPADIHEALAVFVAKINHGFVLSPADLVTLLRILHVLLVGTNSIRDLFFNDPRETVQIMTKQIIIHVDATIYEDIFKVAVEIFIIFANEYTKRNGYYPVCMIGSRDLNKIFTPEHVCFETMLSCISSIVKLEANYKASSSKRTKAYMPFESCLYYVSRETSSTMSSLVLESIVKHLSPVDDTESCIVKRAFHLAVEIKTADINSDRVAFLERCIDESIRRFIVRTRASDLRTGCLKILNELLKKRQAESMRQRKLAKQIGRASCRERV
jgi:hypothetical protein